MPDNSKNRLKKAAAVLFALLIWQVAALLLNESLLLVTPLAVVEKIISIFPEKEFWSTVGFSFVRIVSGFLLGLTVGSILAVAAGKLQLVEIMLWPFMVTIKSVPVASFIILCLIWLSSKSLSTFIAFLMVLPIVYTNMLEGIKNTDYKLLEMAELFRVSWLKRMKFIHLPHLKPYLISACSVSIGLSWKAGIAAEVIGIPEGSIGEKLYEAKVYLSSADLFAWTVVIIILSIAFEKFFLVLLKSMFKKMEGSC